MANIFKTIDSVSLIKTLREFALALRQFFATKSEMNAVESALTDLDNRKIEASDIPTSLPANGGNADYATSAGSASTADSVDWTGVTNKPTSFTPSSHTHTKSEITDFPTSLPANGGNADYATSANGIANSGRLDSQEKIDNFISGNRLKYATFSSNDNNLGFAENDGMILSIPWTSANSGAQIAFDDVHAATVKVRGKLGTWGNWYTLLHSGNYNSYAPKKDGTGASGTWGIDISGNAATASSVDWSGVANKPTSFTPSSHTHPYLPLSGGTLSGDMRIKFVDTDKFIMWDYDGDGSAGASWRIGAKGTGSENANYFCIESGTNEPSASTWNNVLNIGQNDFTVYFSQTPKVGSTNVSLEGHTHPYLPLSGGTLSGDISLPKVNFIRSDGYAILGIDSSDTMLVGLPSYPLKLRSNGTTTINDNTIIHSGNIGSQSVSHATSANGIVSTGMLDSQEKIDNFITKGIFKYATFKTTDSNNLNFGSNDGMILSIPWPSADSGAQIAFDDVHAATVKVRGKLGTWGNWYTILHSGNYNSYAPKKDGTGASGTWGINISGNAATASSVDWGGVANRPTKVSQFTNDAGYITASNAKFGDYLPLSGGTVTGQLYLTGLEEGSSDVTDNTELLTSYASNNGFSDTNATGKVYRRDAIKVYNYIKGKLDSVYSAIGHKHYASEIVDFPSSLPADGGNADTVDGEHASSFAHVGAHNNLIASGNEFTFVPSGFSGIVFFNYRTAGGFDGNITEYKFGNGAGGELGTAIHSGNYNNYAPTLTGTGAYGTWGINISGNAATASNADTIDGYHATCGNNKPWGTIPVITTNGWMDVGKQFEFHYDNTTDSDYSTVLRCTGNYSNLVDLPSESGTLALTSQIPTSLPASDVYDWAKASTKPSYSFSEITPGVATIGDGANRLMFRTHESWKSGIYHSTPGGESMVFANVNPGTSWIFAHTDPTANTDWTTLTPSLQIKNGRVTVNKLIANGTNAAYNLDVNGSSNATELYENGVRVSVSGHTHPYLPLSGGDMNNGARISASGGSLYLGNANNYGWVLVQDVCSQLGTNYWNIAQAGNATFVGTTTSSKFVSTVTTGTQPYACTSTTCNTNLNADLLDGYHANSFAFVENTYGTTGNFVNGIDASNYIARGDLGLVGFDNSSITVELYEATSGNSYSSSPTKTINTSDATYGVNFRKGTYATMHSCAAGSKLKIIVKSSNDYIKSVGIYVATGGNNISFSSTVDSTTKTGSFSTFGSWHVFSCMNMTPTSVTLELNTTNVNCGVIIGGFRTYITNPSNLRFPGVSNSAESVAWGNVTEKPSSYTPAEHNHDTLYPKKDGTGASGTWGINISGNAATASSVDWSGVSNKPASLPANGGTSDYATSAGSASTADSVDWTGVTNKPTSFTPSSHTHTKSDITDFPTSLPANGGNADYATSAGSANGIANSGMLDSQEKIDNFITGNIFKYATFKTTDSNNLNFVSNDGMILSIPWDSAGYGAQMAFDDVHSCTVKVRGKSNTWGNWYTILHSGNYNSYAPKKDGTGASGTWGINISGNAASASKLETARTLTIGNTGKSFDGSSNVSWTLSEIGAASSSHTHTTSEITNFPTSLPANGGNADYAKYLRGRQTNGTYYGSEAGNNIIAEWNTKSDNRWYLKAASTYECRVDYATSAGNASTLGGRPVSDFILKSDHAGDMYETNDEGTDYCEVMRSWEYNPNSSGTFVGIIQVPVPSVKAMEMCADCIKQTNKLTLLVGDKIPYEWKELHWLLRCSNTENIVYTTKYATHDASFPSMEDENPDSPPTIIEISVSYSKTQDLRYVQVTVENMYGRAYYLQKQ